MKISKDLRDKIILAIIGAIFGVISFFGTSYFNEKYRQKQYVGELYKQLYDKGAIELEKINTASSEIQSLLGKDYALTTYEFDPSYTKLQESVELYWKYIRELERYGNSGQVQVAKNLGEWVNKLYAGYSIHYKIIERVQKRVRELLLIEDSKSDIFKFVNNAFNNDIEMLVQHENYIYYEIGRYKIPIINDLEQYFNYQFRTAIGLPVTTDIIKAINNLPELSKRKPESEYKEKKLHFVFAEQRAIFAPTCQIPDDISLIEKNEVLKEQVKRKFIYMVIKNDKDLK